MSPKMLNTVFKMYGQSMAPGAFEHFDAFDIEGGFKFGYIACDGMDDARAICGISVVGSASRHVWAREQ